MPCPNPNSRTWFQLSTIVLFIVTSSSLRGGDWPQILGPARNGIARDEPIVTPWPTGRPRQVWQYPVGEGFAGPAVVGNHVFVFHRVEDVERIEAIDRDSGRPIWKRDFEARYRGTVNPDSGPRCVPLCVGGKVILWGAAGIAHCLDATTGQPLWSRDLRREYGAPEGYFGAGSTPIAVDDVVVFNVGGRNGSGLVGLDLPSGQTVWKATDEDASYSSPIAVNSEGRTRVFVITRLSARLIDPGNGTTLFQMPFGQRGPTVNAATPLCFGNRLFLTASYGIGGKLVEFSERDHREIWANDESLSSQYNTPVFYRDNLLGIHGREDVGAADLRCVDAHNGVVKWNRPGFGVANLILADGSLICVTMDGQLVLVDAAAPKYTELARCQISSSATRALPALSAGRLYVKDSEQLTSWHVGP